MCDVSSQPPCNQPNGENGLKSNINLHIFSTSIGEQRYVYEVLRLRDSVLIFVNLREHRELNDLSVAMRNRFGALPLGTKIMGNFNEENSLGMAKRVSKRLDKTAFVSLNVAADKYVLPMIEKQLFYEIKNRPEMF